MPGNHRSHVSMYIWMDVQTQTNTMFPSDFVGGHKNTQEWKHKNTQEWKHDHLAVVGDKNKGGTQVILWTHKRNLAFMDDRDQGILYL